VEEITKQFTVQTVSLAAHHPALRSDISHQAAQVAAEARGNEVI